MNGIITINSIERISASKIAISLSIGDAAEIITVRYSPNLEEYLTIDRIDAVVMGLIYFAIKNGYDIVSDMPISGELLYRLDNHFIDSLCKNAGYHRTSIKAPIISSPVKKSSIVATGLSCGVDSLYTIMHHSSTEIESMRLTHTAFFDIGSHETGDPVRTRQLYEGRRNLCRRFATEYNLPLIEVSSDIHHVIGKHQPGGYQHIEYDTYMMLFIVLLFQSGFRTYLCSSSNTYDNFRCLRAKGEKTLGCDSYDLLTLFTASVNGLSFISSGGSVLRVDKIKDICHYPPAYKYLNVCINTVENDSTCTKCIRTLAAIDCFGALDKFKDVFDIDYYRKHRTELLYRLYLEGVHQHLIIVKELFPYLRKDLTPLFKINAELYRIKNFIRRLSNKAMRIIKSK